MSIPAWTVEDQDPKVTYQRFITVFVGRGETASALWVKLDAANPGRPRLIDPLGRDHSPKARAFFEEQRKARHREMIEQANKLPVGEQPVEPLTPDPRT